MTKLIDLISSDIVTECLNEIIRVKFEVDSNNFGGVMFEKNLAEALRKNGSYVYTQAQVETLIDGGVSFDFGCEFSEFKKSQKDITSDVYASDLFLFEKVENTLVLIDSLSLKTSINDNDGSQLFIANDADGVVYENIVNGNTSFTVGSVMMVSLNTENLKYSVDYFNGEVEDVVGLFTESSVSEEKITYNLKDSQFGSRSRQVVKVINRNAVTGKKATSFNRGFTVRRDFVPCLVEAGVFQNVTSGKVCFNVDSLTTELLTLG